MGLISNYRSGREKEPKTDVLSAKTLSFRKLSRSASGVSGVMIVYGFVLGERLNLVIQDESLSVCAFHVHRCDFVSPRPGCVTEKQGYEWLTGFTSPPSHFFFRVATSM